MALAAAAWCAVAGAQTVGFATLPPGSLLHAQASVIAKVVQDNSKPQVRVIGYGGDAPILDAVNTQKADFLYGVQMAFWVKKDAPIKNIADLKGKRVPTEWVQQTSVIHHMNAYLSAGGISLNDIVKQS